MKRLGFFHELPHGDPTGPSLRASVDATAADLAIRLVVYLRSGRLLAAVPSPGVDVLDPTRVGVPSPHLLTDGRWMWPADLAYYVESYGVSVPAEFLEDLDDASWTISVTDEEVADLSEVLFDDGL